MELQDPHYDVLEKLYNNHDNKLGLNENSIGSNYYNEIRDLFINEYIAKNDKNPPIGNQYVSNSDEDEYDAPYINSDIIYYFLTDKGSRTYEKYFATLELNKRMLLASEKSAGSAERSAQASEKSADSAERSVHASEVSASAAIRSANAAEDSSKSAHKSNRISFASLIISAIAIICSIVVPIVTLLIK